MVVVSSEYTGIIRGFYLTGGALIGAGLRALIVRNLVAPADTIAKDIEFFRLAMVVVSSEYTGIIGGFYLICGASFLAGSRAGIFSNFITPAHTITKEIKILRTAMVVVSLEDTGIIGRFYLICGASFLAGSRTGIFSNFIAPADTVTKDIELLRTAVCVVS